MEHARGQWAARACALLDLPVHEGGELGISGSTVRVHVARLLEMAPAESRLQLAVMTCERGGEV